MARRALRHRPVHRRRLLLRLRSCRAGPPSATTTSSASRRRCAPSWTRTRPSCARSTPSRTGLALFADQPFKREIIEGVAGASPDVELSAEASVDIAPDAVGSVTASVPTTIGLRRPVPGPARGVDGPARALQAPAGGRRVLARRRASSPAAAHLRHGVGVRQGPGRAPPPPRGGRAARPPPHRGRARPVLVPHRDRLGAGGVPSQGGDHPHADGGVLAPTPRRRAATSSSTRRTSPSPSCSRSRATWTGSPRACSRPWSSTTASGTTSSP